MLGSGATGIEDANYFAADKNQDIGAVSLGYGPDDSR
jgi:hypothetical protein